MVSEQPESSERGLDEWLERRADETGRSPREELARLVAASRLLAPVEADDGSGTREESFGELFDSEAALEELFDDGDAFDELPEGADSLRETLEEAAPLDDTPGGRVLAGLLAEVSRLEVRIESIDEETDAKIEDVRDRTVQAYKEAKRKAPEDHDHEEFERRLGTVADRIAAVDDRASALEERLEGKADAERVATLAAELDERNEDAERLEKLARATVRLRRRVEAVERREADREGAAALKREANRKGVRTADCGDCGRKVTVGMLSRPRCPHCDREFESVDPGGRFFGSPTLRVGDPPELPEETTGGAAEGSDDE